MTDPHINAFELGYKRYLLRLRDKAEDGAELTDSEHAQLETAGIHPDDP